MSDLNHRERELVALGAAIASNCVPCIEYHVPEARRSGLTTTQIRAAIRFADKVRQVPARKVLDAALGLLPEEVPAAEADADVVAGSQQTPAAAGGGLCCG